MALTELKEITEPNGRRPIENSELLVSGEDFDDFYFVSKDKGLMLAPALTKLIRTRFSEDAGEVLNIALSVALRQKRDADFHPIVNSQK